MEDLHESAWPRSKKHLPAFERPWPTHTPLTTHGISFDARRAIQKIQPVADCKASSY